jgi:1-acyl-sn-glycerol-3-phosphate acyltransferase
MLKNLASYFYTLWVFLIFTVFMFVVIPFIVFPFLMGEQFGWIAYKALWLWSWIFGKLTGIRYKLIDRHNIESTKSYIFVSNHTSFLDAPGVRLMIPREFRPLAKKELLKIPIFGWIVKSATIVVDRGDHASRKKSMEKLRTVIARGISPLIFVEGTQNRSKELLQPFKDGAFRMAIETQTDILPIVVIGASDIMYPGKIRITGPGVVKIVAAAPIAVKDFGEDLAGLKQHTFEVMVGLIKANT